MDECGIDTYLYREYGYAPRSQQIFGRTSGRKYKRCGIVAAKMANKILAPLQYSGTMDSSLFEFWFSNQLLPSLDKGTVIVMDNASFHSKKRLISAAQNAGRELWEKIRAALVVHAANIHDTKSGILAARDAADNEPHRINFEPVFISV